MFYRPGKRFFSLRGFELVIMYSIFSGVFGLPYKLASLLIVFRLKYYTIVNTDNADTKFNPNMGMICENAQLK